MLAFLGVLLRSESSEKRQLTLCSNFTLVGRSVGRSKSYPNRKEIHLSGFPPTQTPPRNLGKPVANFSLVADLASRSLRKINVRSMCTASKLPIHRSNRVTPADRVRQQLSCPCLPGSKSLPDFPLQRAVSHPFSHQLSKILHLLRYNCS